jgi:hypothetical protein
LKRFAWLSWNITKRQTGVGDLAELKSDVETGMYFDSSIPQGYGVGSSAPGSCYLWQICQDKITVLENLTVKNYCN